MSDDLPELLAAERRKSQRLKAALAVVVGLLALSWVAFAWRTSYQAAEQQARAEQLAAEARAEHQRALERARREAEAAAHPDATLTEVENALKRAELLRKTSDFMNQKPPEPAPAPAPRAVGP
jgi:hypothetical protein